MNCKHCNKTYDLEYSQKIGAMDVSQLQGIKIDWAQYSDSSRKEEFCGKLCEKKWTDKNEPVERSSGVNFYIENTNPKFNLGLGQITNGTRHAEKVAKQKGLEPIGDAPVPMPDRNRDSKHIDGILREGVRAAKVGRTLEGKPLHIAIKELERGRRK